MKNSLRVMGVSILTALLAVFLTACGGGDGGGDNGDGIQGPNTPNIAKGLFLDAAVEGLSYLSGSQAGVTDAQGVFTYEEGLQIQFSVGDIVIGKAKAKPIMTPIDLVEGASDELNPTVTNIARFLQTLDNDANLENGITITESVRTQSIGKFLNFSQSIADFENDGNLQAIVAELTALTEAGTRTLISTQQAQSHLSRTLLVRRISHTSPQGVTATGDIGLWMFKPSELSVDAIANWLGKVYEGRKLREPVNVLWIDFTSVTEQEARGKVTSFLESSGFFTEVLHSSGYYGFYNDFSGNGVWKQQYGPSFGDDNTVTWVDTKWPNENNHGRIFPSVRIDSTSGAPVYITSGAFSRESACTELLTDILCLTGHNFISFNDARDALGVPGEWGESTKLRVGNEYPPNPLLDFTTGDHDGVRIFALYPFTITITSPVDGAAFGSTEPISFEGRAKNSEGVDLPNNSLVWESDKDGQIGTGPSLIRSNLSIGTHLITLTVTDPQGRIGSESVTINVSTTDSSGSAPWVGNWVQVNFLADDDNGVWDQDDPSGIGFVASVTEGEWIETDEFGNGCSVTYSYTVDNNNKYSKVATSVSNTCPFPLGSFLNESGMLEFSNGNNIMIEHFDVMPGDTLVAFKWMRQQ